MRLAALEQLDRVLLRVPALVTAAEQGELATGTDVHDWLVELEGLLGGRQVEAAASVAALRGLLWVASRGIVPAGMAFTSTPTARRVREATTVEVIRQAEAAVAAAMVGTRAQGLEAERVMRQVVAVARQKQLPGAAAPGPADDRQRAALWHRLTTDADIAGAATRIVGLVGEADALVLLARALEEPTPASETHVVPPSAPQAVAARGGPGRQVTVTWAAPTADGGAPVVCYSVYRVAGTGRVLLTVVPAATMSYAEGGLGLNQAVAYSVSASNVAGEGSPGGPASATTVGPPAAPQRLAVTAGPAGGQVTLTWAAPGADGRAPVAWYSVYREATAGRSLLTTVPAAALSYTEGGIGPNQAVSYSVSASNGAGEGVRAGPVGVHSGRAR